MLRTKDGLNGNALTATTATKLTTSRTINGSSFDGSSNITTSNWGTARTITIGSTGKSVNGSANVSWSLSEIGAAASSHTHNYAGSSSAGGAATSALTCTGNSATATKLATARTIALTGSVTGSGTFDGSGNLSISTTTNHTHSYLPLSGGTLTNKLTVNFVPSYNTSQMSLYTDDGNTSGDGRTHLAYKDGNGYYCHYFRGKGRTYIDTWDGCSIATTLSVGSDLYIAGTSITEAKALVIGRSIEGDFVEAKYRPYHLYNVKDLSTSSTVSIKRGACMISRQSSQQENVFFLSESAISPGWDNGLYCGISSHRFAAVHASTGTVYSSSKDEKENIVPLSIAPANSKSTSVTNIIRNGIKNTNMYSYNYRVMSNEDTYIGFIGQELEEQDPVFFSLIGNSYETEAGKTQYDIRESSVIGVLWTGLQSALQEIDEMKEQISSLQTKLNESGVS